MEDNDDNDDTATGKCRWVLSIKDKPKLNSLAFKTRPTASTQLRVLTRARAKTEAGEEATDADATAFCTAVASTKNKRKLYIIVLWTELE